MHLNSTLTEYNSATLNKPLSTTKEKSSFKSDNPTDMLVIEILGQKGPKTRKQLVAATNIARSTLYDSLLRLIVKGVVFKYSKALDGPGRPHVYFSLKK